MKKKIIAIAQPTFMPWIGWFDLMDQVDLFVILDDVAFSKQSWQQRNRIRATNGLNFLTVPIKTSGRLGQLITECELADQSFIVKMVKSIQVNYSKAPFFHATFDEFRSVLEAGARTNYLLELNCRLIFWMAEKLGISTLTIRSTELNVGGERGEHVALICDCVGAGRYLSPVGAEVYLIEDKSFFDQRDIEVLIHAYEHPIYEQRFSPFIPFASALDLIFNLGPASGQVMRSGRCMARALNENK